MARTIDSRPYKFTFSSFVTGHHIYKEIWTPQLGEIVFCYREPENQHDRYAVAAYKDDQVIGHIPRTVSKPCSYALLAGAKIQAVVTGERQNKRKNGLEIPVKYQVKGPRQHMISAETYICALAK